MPSARLAVDIGGTFTDLALEHDGRRTTIKVLTTPAAPEQGVMAGVREILQRPAWRRLTSASSSTAPRSRPTR